jgi:hypothetical protein
MKRKLLAPNKVSSKNSPANTIWFSSPKPPKTRRFMESLHFFFETHWDHEPGRVAFVRAPRSVTAQYFGAPVSGLLVGKIGSG